MLECTQKELHTVTHRTHICLPATVSTSGPAYLDIECSGSASKDCSCHARLVSTGLIVGSLS